jgi:glycosyltransferase involved in cell wall biosynthesis
MSSHSTLAIPCHDEARRLSRVQIERLLRDPRLALVLVDDGSRDETGAVLAAIAADHPGRVEVLSLVPNRGKGEAVRAGLLRALERDARFVGFADADFATPPEEILHLLDCLDGSELEAVLGSRVARLGSRIDRSPARHYLGRVFATLASLTLDVPVYDTQCGAKWFRAGAPLREALAKPFSSRWAFDVELLGRLLGAFRGPGPFAPPSSVLEVPVRAWRDVEGSKLKPRDFPGAMRDVVGLLVRARVARRAPSAVQHVAPPSAPPSAVPLDATADRRSA